MRGKFKGKLRINQSAGKGSVQIIHGNGPVNVNVNQQSTSVVSSVKYQRKPAKGNEVLLGKTLKKLRYGSLGGILLSFAGMLKLLTSRHDEVLTPGPPFIFLIALLVVSAYHAMRAWGIFLKARRPNDPIGPFFLGVDFVIEDNGDYMGYTYSAPCTNPECTGEVYLVHAPPREAGNHDVAGVCNKGGHQHTYTFDCTLRGEPWRFDWRQIEAPKR